MVVSLQLASLGGILKVMVSPEPSALACVMAQRRETIALQGAARSAVVVTVSVDAARACWPGVMTKPTAATSIMARTSRRVDWRKRDKTSSFLHSSVMAGHHSSSSAASIKGDLSHRIIQASESSLHLW
jgi:hypothetical protein